VIVRGRNALNEARDSLRRLIDEQPGPQTSAMLIARAAVRLGQIDQALNELDEIGMRCKAAK
jgi:predicted Zn-dependent protease